MEERDSETIGFDEIRAFEAARRTRRSTDLIFRAYSLFGLTATSLGVSYLFLREYIGEIDENNARIIFFIILGIAITLISQFYLLFRRERQRRALFDILDRDKLLKFLERWKELEELVTRLDGGPESVTSPRKIINTLRGRGMIDRAEAETLESALAVRNSIVHSRVEIPIDVVDRYLAELTRIVDKASGAPVSARD
jgi:hypothetical protein